MRSPLLPFVLCAAGLAAHAHAQPLGIEDLAPRDAFAVVGADDWSAVHGSAERAGLLDLWDDPQVRGWLERIGGEMWRDFTAALERADVERESLTMPERGPVGLAAFLAAEDAVPPASAALPRGAEGAPPVQILLLRHAPEGERSDALWDALSRLADHAVKEFGAARDQVEIAGVDAERIAFDYKAMDERDAERDNRPAPLRQPGDDGDEVFQDEWEEAGDTWMNAGLPPVLLLARAHDAILVSSHQAALRDALERLEGVQQGQAVRDHPRFAPALGQHGGADNRLWAVLLMEPLRQAAAVQDGLLGALGALSATAMLAQDAGLLGAMGLADLHALSASARMDTPDAPLEITLAALAPEKAGLLSLIDGPAEPHAVPAFVPADAASITVQRVNFSRLIPTVRGVMAELPAQERAQAMGALDMFSAQFEPILQGMSDRLVLFSRIEQPYAPDSQRTTAAVALRDEAAVRNAVSALAPNLGLASRDFQGQQIWEAEFLPFAVGLGFGHVFVGDAPAVEGAMREAARPQGAGLAADDAFNRALRATSGRGVGFGFSRTRPALEFASWSAANFETLLRAEFADAGLADAELDAFVRMAREQTPPWLREPLPVDAILRHVGDTASEVRATPEGFTYRMLLLAPAP